MKGLLGLIDGKKFNTGVIITIAALILQNLLGVGHDAAVSIASNIMLGIGGVTTLIGYIHKLIKEKEAKNKPDLSAAKK